MKMPNWLFTATVVVYCIMVGVGLGLAVATMYTLLWHVAYLPAPSFMEGMMYLVAFAIVNTLFWLFMAMLFLILIS